MSNRYADAEMWGWLWFWAAKVRCPFCRAAIGARCRSNTGLICPTPHVMRLDKRRQLDAATHQPEGDQP